MSPINQEIDRLYDEESRIFTDDEFDEVFDEKGGI